MIAVDTNVLVYAHRADSPWHAAAARTVGRARRGARAVGDPLAVPSRVLRDRHAPRIYKPPTPVSGAIDQIEAWLESPSLVPLGEAAGYWQSLKPLLLDGLIEGPRVHDARIAALCLQHGVGELWSADRDFSRFPGLKVRNPLVS